MFKSLMHIALYTDNMDEMIRFYTEVLGAVIKVRTTYRSYLDRDDRPEQQKIAGNDPERIFNVYLELAEGQFIELFPKKEGQINDVGWGERLGYHHYALLVDDIYKAREELSAKGLQFDTDISKGPSGTYQMWAHDPDGNKFEIMQFTADSYQVKGHIE